MMLRALLLQRVQMPGPQWGKPTHRNPASIEYASTCDRLGRLYAQSPDYSNSNGAGGAGREGIQNLGFSFDGSLIAGVCLKTLTLHPTPYTLNL